MWHNLRISKKRDITLGLVKKGDITMTRRGWRMWAEAKCDGQTNKQTDKQGLLYIDLENNTEITAIN